MRPRDWPRVFLTGAVIALFGLAYLENTDDEMMKGALIAAFSLAISYWLGSSKGSADKSAELARHSPELRSAEVMLPDAVQVPPHQ